MKFELKRPQVTSFLLITAFCLHKEMPNNDFSNLKNPFQAGKRLNHQVLWQAKELFDQSTSQRLMYSSGQITLENSILIEDDGPACGYSSNPSALEIIDKTILIKKILHLDAAPVNVAYIAMLVYPEYPPEPNNGRHLVFKINGHEIIYEVNHFWTNVPVPAEYLKRGDNEIIISVLEPDTKFKTWVALKENFKIGSLDRHTPPNRSFRSLDQGMTWTNQLGINGEAVGEYSVRLKLTDYFPEGWLVSPVIDLAKNSNWHHLLRKVKIRKLRLEFDLEPKNAKVDIHYRSGSSHFFNEADWSDWKKLDKGTIGATNIDGRFFQLKMVMKKQLPNETPVLKKVRIQSEYELLDDTPSSLEVIHYENRPTISSSFPFEYEKPSNIILQELRKKYDLDSVVKGTENEFQKIVKLKSWVSSQWKWHLLPPEIDFSRWNALDILSVGPDGRIQGGYCLHYAIVLMQALQSFGIPARIVNANYSVWGGHEMTEVWSNDFGKWVLMDPNYDTYFISTDTGVPLNLLELHKNFLDIYYPGEILDRNNWPRRDMVSRAARVGKPKNISCIVGGHANLGTLTDYQWWMPDEHLTEYGGGYGLLNAAFIRYLPRSNYLEKPYPVPINHGRTHWGWTGYYCWYDQQTPRTVEHDLFTNRVNDLYWNLNEVDFSAEILSKDQLKIRMTTNSPYFKYYELEVNDNLTFLKENCFILNLNPGLNTLKMRVVDEMNNKGALSVLKVNVAP